MAGRLGYFSALRQRDGRATAAELATAQNLDPWRTAVWCKAACTVGILRGDDETDETSYSFAPFMDELLADNAPDLLTSHVLASLSAIIRAIPRRFGPERPRPFTTTTKTSSPTRGGSRPCVPRSYWPPPETARR